MWQFGTTGEKQGPMSLLAIKGIVGIRKLLGVRRIRATKLVALCIGDEDNPDGHQRWREHKYQDAACV
jgi:hypothetical protein